MRLEKISRCSPLLQMPSACSLQHMIAMLWLHTMDKDLKLKHCSLATAVFACLVFDSICDPHHA